MPQPALVTVYVTNAVRTSAGPGHGALQLPAPEAARLVAGRRAVYGDRPPRGYAGELDDGLRH